MLFRSPVSLQSYPADLELVAAVDSVSRDAAVLLSGAPTFIFLEDCFIPEEDAVGLLAGDGDRAG